MLGEKKILKIALLGPPVVTFEDLVQTIKRKQTRSVLYFLACQKEPVSRGYLISKFWPNLPELDGRKNLREILSNLRSHFENVDVIVSRYDQLSLDPAITEVDAVRFQNMVDRVHFNLYTMPSGKLPDSLYRELREGVSLWRTPYFMEGFLQQLPELETWISETGNVLQSWRQSFVERLADHNISSGNLEEAVYWLFDALRVEPLKTDLHYLVLTCLRDSGKTEAILRYRESLERTYTVTYGMEVPQVLMDFINRISDSQKQFAPNPAGNDQEALFAHMTPFVGRKEVLHQLNTWSLGGGVVVLRGESGIGKTRTMQEFHNRIDYPFRSLYCNARPLEQNLPLRPFIEGLKQTVKQEEWFELDARYTDTLLNVFPVLPLTLSEAGSQERIPAQDQQSILFEAILDLMNILIKRKRLIVFFDNAQWADEASINLLAFLTNRGVFQKKGLLILAHRLEEQNPFLQQYITHVQSRPDYHNIMIDHMSDVEAQELAYSLLGKIPPAEMIARLKSDVGGNPLFLIQTLKLMMDYSTNMDSLASLQSYPVAREAILAMKGRLETMDHETRMVLDAAAVIGEFFTPELLEDVTQLKEIDLARITDDLVNLHVIKVVPGSGLNGGYVFSHHKMQQAILAALNPTRRRMLYRQVIDAMQKRYGERLPLASKYANYYELAGDVKEAYAHWLQAALYSYEKSQSENVTIAYKKALALLESAEEQISDNEIYRLFASWGSFAFDQNDLETCEMVFNKCLELGEKRYSRLLQGTAHSGIARLMGLRRQMVTARKHLNLALKNLTACEPGAALINAHLIQGYLSHEVHDFSAAREFYKKAAFLPIANEDLSTASPRATALALLSVLYSQMGDLKNADETADLSIEHSRTIGGGSARIHGYIAKCLAQFYLANYREVIDLSKTVTHHFDAFETANWAALFYSVLSGSYLSLGLLDKAWTAMERAQSFVHEFSPIGLDSLVPESKGDIYLLMEHLDEAESEYSKAVDCQKASYFNIESHYKLGYVKCLKGDQTSGLSLIDKAVQEAAHQSLEMITYPAEALRLLIIDTTDDRDERVARLNVLANKARESRMGILPLCIQLFRLISAVNDAAESKAGEAQVDLAKEAFAISNIWLELNILLQIAGSSKAASAVRKRSWTRIRAILDTLSENASIDPVKEMVRGFVEGVERKLATFGE